MSLIWTFPLVADQACYQSSSDCWLGQEVSIHLDQDFPGDRYLELRNAADSHAVQVKLYPQVKFCTYIKAAADDRLNLWLGVKYHHHVYCSTMFGQWWFIGRDENGWVQGRNLDPPIQNLNQKNEIFLISNFLIGWAKDWPLEDEEDPSSKSNHLRLELVSNLP